ncbi:protein serine/threonine phosphatase 2C [Fomes fomentarius]|nr:protein serine/threonine phosphatase 2C [Fomes fomentarius]
MSTFEALRERLAPFYTSTVTNSGIHSVIFQPYLGKKVEPEDRVVTHEWNILGQRWTFLVVCDGHGGANTADYTAKTLPGRIRLALTKIITDELNGQLDRQNVARADPIVAAMITREIEALDAEIGARIQDICANPGVLNEQEARALTQEHFEPLLLGFNGTTLAAALVNVTHRFVWGIGVGDSTVAVSTVEPNGTRHAQRLCTPHSLDDPEEVARAISGHPPDETGVVANGRIVGWLALPRAIGDFSLKLPSTYLSHLFKYLPHTGSLPLEGIPERIKTPPYVIATPSVQFTDLEPLKDSKPIIALYSDGVDLLVDGYVVFRRGTSSEADSTDIVAKLLQDQVDPSVEEVLGHKIDLRWSGAQKNKAVDVLGNLIGGVNTERLEMMLDKELFAKGNPMFYVDDTTIVLYPL